MTLTFTLLSWNLHGLPLISPSPRERHFRAMTDALAGAPDVVLLQEVWDRRTVSYATPWMAAAGYRAVELPGGPAGSASGGLLSFYRANAWTAAGDSFFDRYDTTSSKWRFWEGDGLSGKGFQGFRLTHHTGQPVAFVNTHLQSQYGKGREYTEVRKAQVAELAAAVARFSPDAPLLVAGDFNTLPEEWPAIGTPPAWRELTADLRQTCKSVSYPGRCVSYLGKPGEWLDYIFARDAGRFRIDGELEMIMNTAIDNPYSDHEGLKARVTVREAAAPTTSVALAAGLIAAGSRTTRREWLALLGASGAGLLRF